VPYPVSEVLENDPAQYGNGQADHGRDPAEVENISGRSGVTMIVFRPPQRLSDCEESTNILNPKGD